MLPPTPAIRFTGNDSPAGELVQYIERNTGIGAARQQLDSFCSGLQQDAAAGKQVVLEGVGSFTKDTAGEWIFQQQEFPAAFAQPVKAERVIHPEAAHSMLVGDKETTTSVMTEYYNETPGRKDYWWVWAIVLAALAVATIIIYCNDSGHSSSFGNAVSYKLA